MNLHLLDGTYELFRNYYGAPKRTSLEGVELGAVQGLMASVLSLLHEDGVTHVGAAFDTVIRSFRNELFPGYKTGAGVPADLLAQFPIAEDGLEALGVVVWRMTTYEADDALATAAARFAPEVEQVVLMSPDKDLAQCVRGHRVVGYDRRKGAFIDEAGVWEKFGVAPESIPDYLALVGDSADGLPGVRGWGPRPRRRSWPSTATWRASPSRRRSGSRGCGGRNAWWRRCGEASRKPWSTGSWRPCGTTCPSARAWPTWSGAGCPGSGSSRSASGGASAACASGRGAGRSSGPGRVGRQCPSAIHPGCTGLPGPRRLTLWPSRRWWPARCPRSGGMPHAELRAAPTISRCRQVEGRGDPTRRAR
ncbi:MAG: hypothetical protein ABIJ48_06030 [Actinomycetota bacterium]